jgi:hypothetical protein
MEQNGCPHHTVAWDGISRLEGTYDRAYGTCADCASDVYSVLGPVHSLMAPKEDREE